MVYARWRLEAPKACSHGLGHLSQAVGTLVKARFMPLKCCPSWALVKCSLLCRIQCRNGGRNLLIMRGRCKRCNKRFLPDVYALLGAAVELVAGLDVEEVVPGVDVGYDAVDALLIE